MPPKRIPNFLMFTSSLLLLWGSLCPHLNAQFHETFDSQTPTWNRRDFDCTLPDARWSQRRSHDLKQQNRFEKISFQNGHGTQILIAHPLPASYVISELTPSIRLKASRPGIQMMVRVVLPHTPSPLGDGPLTTLLPGPVYRSAEKWETLSFASENQNLKQKLQEEIWILRRKYGSHVTPRDAFVDNVVLNLYTGTGENIVQIDDLKLDGIIDATRLAREVASGSTVHRDTAVQPASYNQGAAGEGASTPSDPNKKHSSLVTRDGTVLLVKGKPFLPRLIQHHGESFEFLKSLGFNTIEMGSTATRDQLNSARGLDLWIVCPPPTSVGLEPIGFEYDRVLAWSVGNRLTGRNLQSVAQRVREIRESDSREGRPIVGNTISHESQFGRHLDILSVGLEPIGTSFLASQYSAWLAERSQSVSHSKPVWADIQTDFPKQLSAQIKSIAETIPPTPMEPQQMKFLVYEAISGAARGLRFRSRSRLDAPDPETRLRATTLEWLNTEIDRLEPWIVAGAILGETETSDPELQITAISTNRSRLLLIQRPTHHEQYVAGDLPVRTVQFTDPNTTFSQRTMLLSESGLTSLPSTRSFGGNEIRIENCPYTAAVVLSETPMVFSNLHQTYQRSGGLSTAQLHLEITRQWLAIMQLIEGQMGRMGRSTSSETSALSEAVNAFQNASRLIESGSLPTAMPFLDRADERLAFVRREMVTEPLGQFQSKMSSPLLAHTSLIPLHWNLSQQLQNAQWNPNGLPGGDFEDLQHLQRSGWENRRLDDDQVVTSVELSDTAAVDGQFGLRLEVRSKTGSSTIDATPLWITSPRIPVRGRQLVRIHGWVKIPETIRGNMDGLMISDSLGGEAMAERIPMTDGWQEFTLYRGVTSDNEIQLTFALTGVGVALLDEVTIRTVDLPSPGRTP